MKKIVLSSLLLTISLMSSSLASNAIKTKADTTKYNLKQYKNVILLSENSSLPFVRWDDENNKGYLTNYVTGKKALENIDYIEIKPIYEKDHFTEYAVVHIFIFLL